jgi:hemoglobin/transferrin/lactoferrin receptor protein
MDGQATLGYCQICHLLIHNERMKKAPSIGAINDLSAFHQTGDRQFDSFVETVWYRRDILTFSELQTGSALLQADWNFAWNHRVISGVQYLEDSVEQERFVDTFAWSPPGVTGEEMIEDVASIETLALFVQDHWSPSDKLSLIAGLRHYEVSGELEDTDRIGLDVGSLDDDSELIASLGIKWYYADTAMLRFNVAEGYLYPSLMQLATGAYAGSRFVSCEQLAYLS